MNILIAEDDAISRLVLRRSVEKLGHKCTEAKDGLEAWASYEASPPDVVVSDWLMPGMEGIEFCRRVRERERNAYTYFIFMTALADKQHYLRGMEAGADDYLSKPVDMADLAVRLLAAARVTSLHKRLVDQNAELERLGKASFEAARTDPLTKLANRLRLREDLEAIRPLAARYGHRYSAALCDVDHFKRYNDHHGHLAGDQALRRVAEVLSHELRSGDVVYRFGGEEFLALLPEQTEDRAIIAMDRVRSALEKAAIAHDGKDPRGVVTMSVGVAALSESDTPPWDAWMKRADRALYAAKQAGRNRVLAFGALDDDAPPRTGPSHL